MRIYGFIFAIILNILPTWAQETREQFRDSLKAATELLAYHPDSTDLQLRKAGWNIQLEQWDYAKNEYDKILAREPITSRHVIIELSSMKNYIAILLHVLITRLC